MGGAGRFFPDGSPMASDVGMAALTGPRDLAKARDDARRRPAIAARRSWRSIAGEGKTVKPITDVAVDMLQKVGMNSR